MLYNLEGVDELQQSFEKLLSNPLESYFWSNFQDTLKQVSEKNRQAIDYWAKSYVYQLQTYQQAFEMSMPFHAQMSIRLEEAFRDAWMETLTQEHVYLFVLLQETYLFIQKPL